MKKNLKNLMRACALLVCVLAGTQMASAQTFIKNDGACAVIVDIDVYDNLCGGVCNPISGITIPAGTAYTIPNGMSCATAAACNIAVTVTNVGANSVTVPACDYSSGPQPISGAPAGCLHGASISYNGIGAFKIQ